MPGIGHPFWKKVDKDNYLQGDCNQCERRLDKNFGNLRKERQRQSYSPGAM
jgi:hypothetical protein